MPKVGKYGKIVFSDADIEFVKEHFYLMTNQELANALGVTLTVTRNLCYSMGLKRMDLCYWTDEQVDYLIKNYKHQGDTEIAEYFDSIYYKDKGWSKKHIEKKRRYLKLKRTPPQIKAIHARNVRLGRFKCCPVKALETRGVTPEGTIKLWKRTDGTFYVIKTKKGFVHLNRYLWERDRGKIPDGMVVRMKEGVGIPSSADDYELITRFENARRNSQNRYNNLPPELVEIKKLINKINKKIRDYETPKK